MSVSGSVKADLNRQSVRSLVQLAAIGVQEHRLVEPLAEAICVWYEQSSPKPLHVLLMECAVSVVKREARVKFIYRLLVRLNRYTGSSHVLPTQLVAKELTNLIDPSLQLSQWAGVLPALVRHLPPGALKLAWLMSHAMGFGPRAIDACLLIGPRELRRDLAFCVPISRHDTKHEHIIWLPEALRAEVVACLQRVEVFKSKEALDAALKKELALAKRQFGNGSRVSEKDSSTAARQLRGALAMGELSLKKLTVAVFIKAARMYGVAMSMPGYLRDMLKQTVLPTSADRISLMGILPRALPQSPNYQEPKPRVIDEALSRHGTSRDNDYIRIMSHADGLPEVVWAEWRSTSRDWVKAAMAEVKWKEALEKTIVETISEGKFIAANSWCAWAMQFLCQQRVKNSWGKTTWLKYRNQLLPPELSAFTSALDVEEFDEEDLSTLIGLMEQRGTSETTLRSYISLILRMIQYAQNHQPDKAFPQISLERKEGGVQRNRRAHILSPSEIETAVESLIDKGLRAQALVIALIGFTGMRPIEIMYLRKQELTLLPGALEINVERSKTPAGKRCLPVYSLAPKKVHAFLLGEFDELIRGAKGDEVFFEADVAKLDRRERLITPALKSLRDNFGEGIDLYTLRHSFASWSFVRMNMLASPSSPIWRESPNLGHELFRSGLNGFGELVFCHREAKSERESFYRLCRLMGHATPDTLPKIYIHSAGLVHSALLRTGMS